MTTYPERPIKVDPNVDPMELRYVFDPRTILNAMAANCMTFFIFQHQYRKTIGNNGPKPVELVNARAAFLLTLDSYKRAITHPADPQSLEALRQIAEEAEEQLRPILEQHGIEFGVFGNYGVIYEHAGEEALRLQVLRDLGMGETFEIQSYAGLS